MELKLSYVFDALIILLLLGGLWIGINRERFFEVHGSDVYGTATTFHTLEKEGFMVHGEVNGYTFQGSPLELEGRIVGADERRVYILEEGYREDIVHTVGEWTDENSTIDIVPRSFQLDPIEDDSNVITIEFNYYESVSKLYSDMSTILEDTGYEHAFVSADLFFSDEHASETDNIWELKNRISGGIQADNVSDGYVLDINYMPYGHMYRLDEHVETVTGFDTEPVVLDSKVKFIVEDGHEQIIDRVETIEEGKVNDIVIR